LPSAQGQKGYSSPMSAYRPSVLSKARLHTTLPFCLFVLIATSVFGQQAQVLLGDTAVESSVDNNSAGTAEAFPVQAVATGQVSSLSVYLDPSNRASTVRVGVYASSNGHPQALLSSGVIANAVAGQWNSVAMPPMQVTSGTTYWLASLGVDGAVRFRDRVGNCQSEVGRLTNLSSLPATWTTGSRWPTCIVSMFESGSVTSGSVPTSVGISISPRTISLQAGQKQQFTAAVTGLSNPAVTWTASGGTINNVGLYTAPAAAGTYIVTANAAPSRRRRRSVGVTPGSAVVTVTASAPPPVTSNIQVSVSPTAASLQTGAQQQFSASVSGTSNAAVTWSASGGSIAASGMYTAPSNAGTYTITAISNSDSAKSGSALAVVSAPQPVAVSISPGSASVEEANQVQFTATVSGLSNTAVTWVVTRGTGTITQSGLFTAPQAAESDVITATSQGNTTKSASASITVLPPHSVTLNWSASASTVAFYKVYRGAVSGGPYSLLSANVKATTYTDSTVQSGTTYYYVTSAVDAAGTESIFSNQFQSLIP
jgi:Big-like domain-containing protein